MAKIITKLNDYNPENASQSLDALCYRKGWVRSEFKDEGIFMGCSAIPFKEVSDHWMENKNWVIALDGEIFDWQDANYFGSITERLLFLFEKHGLSMVDKINGNFTVLIWNKNKKELTIINDRLGLQPLYFSQYQGTVIFTSEVKAILADKSFFPKVDVKGLIELFTYDYIFEERTLLEGISVFPAASTAIVKANDISVLPKRYWVCSFEIQDKDKPLESYSRELNEIFEKVVSRQIDLGGRVGIPLSGGLDSRSIFAYCIDKINPLHTFTFGVKGSGDEKYARRLSKTGGAQHHMVGFDRDRVFEFMKTGVFFTDGLVNCQHFHIFQILELLPKYVDVTLMVLWAGWLIG